MEGGRTSQLEGVDCNEFKLTSSSQRLQVNEPIGRKTRKERNKNYTWKKWMKQNWKKIKHKTKLNKRENFKSKGERKSNARVHSWMVNPVLLFNCHPIECVFHFSDCNCRSIYSTQHQLRRLLYGTSSCILCLEVYSKKYILKHVWASEVRVCLKSFPSCTRQKVRRWRTVFKNYAMVPLERTWLPQSKPNETVNAA